MPIQNIRTMKMGPGILEIGNTTPLCNLARRCLNAVLTPSVNREDNRIFLSGDEEAGSRTETWELTGTLAQDYGETDSIWEFLFDHRGEVMPFRYQPDKTVGRPVKGRLIVEAISLGGDVNSKPSSDFAFPLVGPPELDDTRYSDTPDYVTVVKEAA